MKTMIILIPTTDYAAVAKARESAIKYLGTRILDSETDYVTGAIAVTTKLEPEEKARLADILYAQDVGVIFIEHTKEEEDAVCKQKSIYIDAKLSI